MNNNYALVGNGSPNLFYLNSDDQVHGTPMERTAYFEIATYLAADTIVITAELVDGSTRELLNICNLATWTTGDQTGGIVRPLSDTILQFISTIPRGTKTLKFDFTNALSPTYLGMWNLEDFKTELNNPSTNPFLNTVGVTAQNFRVMSSLPAALNDNADPAYPGLCP